jgi:hypothetical protein
VLAAGISKSTVPAVPPKVIVPPEPAVVDRAITMVLELTLSLTCIRAV